MAKFEDLVAAFDYVSAGAPSEHEAYLCIPTGVVYIHTEIGDNDEPLPEDIADTTMYVAIPHKNDLDLGKHLVLKFVAQALPGDLNEVENIFRRKGSYGRFKSLLVRRAKLEQWHEFEDTSQRQALREWCAANGIELES